MLGTNIPEILYIFNDFCGYFNNDELVRILHKQVKTLTVRITGKVLTNGNFACHNGVTQAASVSPGEAIETLTPNRSFEVEGCHCGIRVFLRGAMPSGMAFLLL